MTSGFAGFANYAQALGDGNFIASIGRMLLFGVVQVPVMIVLATILALLLESAWRSGPACSAPPTSCSRRPRRDRHHLVVVPLRAGAQPDRRRRRLDGSEVDSRRRHRAVVDRQHRHLELRGYNMLIIVARCSKAIPNELYEAARVDGATPFQIAWRIQIS